MVAALSTLADVLDRLFAAWGSEEVKRVGRLGEGNQAFRRSFGRHHAGDAARSLLELAGFDHDEAHAAWVYRTDDLECRLRGLAVRLCLQKSAELQKLRGTLRWAQSSNEAVVPKPEDGSLLELLGLYRTTTAAVPALERTSARERNVEVAVRTKLHERRVAALGGGTPPPVVHDGLAGIARAVAQAQRLHARAGKDDSRPRLLASEVRTLLGRLPLPPGFDAAHLHWSSHELPHIFGLASTTGKSNGGGGDDQAADVLATEAVSFWAARQADDVAWPCAAIVGVGVALDYTINRRCAPAQAGGSSDGPSALEPRSSVWCPGPRPRRWRGGGRLEAQVRRRGCRRVHG